MVVVVTGWVKVRDAAGNQTASIESEGTDLANLTSDQAEVIASISQELRQPMSSIIGYADLLLGELR